MKFYKYHGLGNDYLILSTKESSAPPNTMHIKKLCNRHYGIGSDGILYGPLPSEEADFALRIFNPDGSEAEKSGNGLRIFSQFLFDQKYVSNKTFSVETLGGVVECQVHEPEEDIEVSMGKVSFNSADIPLIGLPREAINEKININNEDLTFHGANIGNPHCIIPLPEIRPDIATTWGPLIENHSLFPKKTNVQFLQVLDRENIKIEIWERGAGYTLASGSSSCAAAAIAHKLALCDAEVNVHMPGGKLRIKIGQNYQIRQKGPANYIGIFDPNPKLIEDFAKNDLQSV